MDVEKLRERQSSKTVTIYSTISGSFIVVLSNQSRNGQCAMIGKYNSHSEALRYAKRATSSTYGPARSLIDASLAGQINQQVVDIDNLLL